MMECVAFQTLSRKIINAGHHVRHLNQVITRN
jgi:hypothetical protein